MKTKALVVAAALASLIWASACTPAQDGDVIAKLTVSKSGALVTANGRVLRAHEHTRYAGYRVEFVRTSSSGRAERLIDQNGNVERERTGDATDADAQSAEQTDGDSCTVFTDSAGNQVANGCATPEPGQGDVRCERLDTFDASGAALICAVCYDQNGQVVTRECHGESGGVPGCDPNNPDTDCMPPPTCTPDDATGQGCVEPPICASTNDPSCVPPPVEECRLVHQGDQTCRVCATADGQTYTECYVDPDPTRCEVMQTSDGLICTYCFDANGELVERNCVPLPCQPQPLACPAIGVDIRCDDNTACPADFACINGECLCDPTLPPVDDNCPPPPPVRCEEFVSQDGTYCKICYDELGNVIERWCEQQPPPPTDCREYREDSGRVCKICMGANGEIVSRECTEPPCQLDQTGSNMPTFACQADADCPAGARCLDGICGCASVPPPPCRLFQTVNGYYCEICGDANGDGVEDLSDARCYPQPVDPIVCEEVQSSDGQRCVICYDPAGNVVQDGCHVEPPRCVVQESADSTGANGQACEICYDDAGNVIHNSCDQVVCTIEQIEENGQIIECQVCQSATGEISRICRAPACDPNSTATDCQPPPPACDPTTGSTDPNSGVAPVDCVQKLTVWFDPIQCTGNPWERLATGTNDQNLDQTALVRAWLASLNVVAYSIRFELFYQTVCDACQCQRGDRLFIETDEAGARILMQYGFQIQ